MSLRILCVDDEANALSAYQRTLRKQFQLDTALSGAEALSLIKSQGPYAVIVADMRMPEMNGVQLLAEVKRLAPDTIRIMLTGNADQHTAMEAVNQGHIFRFLTKPCAPETLLSALNAGLEQHRLISAERELLEKTLNGSVRLLTEVLSLVDPVAFGRGQVLKENVVTVARHLQVTSTWDLELGAMLAEIGCVTLPPAVLAKWQGGALLSGAERDLIARLPEFGARLLVNIPRLEPVARMVRYQHKFFDGTGQPNDEVAGQDIPLGARILKVLTDLADLQANGKPKYAALQIMQQRSGCYDPVVLQAAADSLGLHVPEAAPAIKRDAAVPLKELHPGYVLLSDVKSLDDMLIVKAGVTISIPLLERLRNFASTSGVQEPIVVRVPEGELPELS